MKTPNSKPYNLIKENKNYELGLARLVTRLVTHMLLHPTQTR